MSNLVLRTSAHLASSGAAVGRHPDGRVVFVHGAAPDEEVEAEIVREKGRFLEAETVRVLTPGSARVEPACPIFGACGGCATQHVAYATQLESKVKALEDALGRVGKLELAPGTVRPPWSGPPLGYRSRARLAVAPDGTVGFRRSKSHGVVQVERCPVLVPALNEALSDLARSASNRIVEVDVLALGDAVLVQDATPMAHDDGHGTLHYSAKTFTQSNPFGNEALYAELEALVGPGPLEDVLELYAGHGNFTRILAARARRVVAIEGDQAAVELARRALPQVDHRAEPVEAGVEGLRQAASSFELALADPPRAGMSPEVLEAVSELTHRLLYVSCDAGTFARDAGRLAALGLELRSVRLFDLYPQTPHAEVLGVFQRG